MPVTNTFIKQVKPAQKPSGDTFAEGGGLYLLVKLQASACQDGCCLFLARSGA